MSESEKKQRFKIGRKPFIILIASICLIALIAEAVLLIHTFLKKKKAREKEQEPVELVDGSMVRVSEAVIGGAGREITVQFKYDGQGREIYYVEQTVKDGETVSTVVQETTYYPGNCRIVKQTADDEVSEWFVIDNPVFRWISESNSRMAIRKIDRYEAKDGKLTKVVFPEYNYGIDSWEFDSEGRPVRLYHNDANPEYRYFDEFRYDEEGRVIVIPKNNELGVTYISYEGNTIRYSEGEGMPILEEREYDGQRLVRMTSYGTNGNKITEELYYYPKGNYDFTGDSHVNLKRADYSFAEDILLMKSVWNGKKQTYEYEVSVNADGQPFRLYNPETKGSNEFLYDTNGLVKEIDSKLPNGDVLTVVLIEHDRNGNLTYATIKEIGYTCQYKWTKIE